MNEAGDDRGTPWASLFDPVANARALADVQALGLRAAGELVERFVQSVDDGGPTVTRDAPADANGSASGPAGEVGRLLEVWMQLLRQTAETFAGASGASRSSTADGTGAGTSPAGVRIDAGAGSGPGIARVTVDPHGASVDGVAEIWLHNDTTEPVGPLEVHCADLRSPEGDVLAAGVRFEPARIRELPARSGRGIGLCVGASGPLAAGTYRTVVQVAGVPSGWLPLEVVVAEPSS
jgi:hypothetical protein